MINNRTLAVAAAVLLGIPALGAAAPIVVNDPTPEQLVEGHTVFTVIEVVNNATTIKSRYAAAVAILVREYEAQQNNVRFPGVLWFNDQYLVDPKDPQNANQASFRYPCGGAVMAVNAGDPDPRVVLLTANDGSETRDAITGYEALLRTDDGNGISYGDNDNPTTTAPNDGPDPTPGNSSDDPDSAWFNVTRPSSGTPSASIEDNGQLDRPGSATSATEGWFSAPGGATSGGSGSATEAYSESYYITDPNDHVWIIDKYNYYSRRPVSGDIQTSQVVYNHTVWVVNILGGPVFIPDDGLSSCGPYNDLISRVLNEYGGPGVGTAASPVAQAGDGALRDPWEDDAVNHTRVEAEDPDGNTVASRDVYAPFHTYYQRDHVYGQYEQPSDNGFCYNGNRAPASGTCPVDGADGTSQSLRIYNALLYFNLEDLKVSGQPRDHSNPLASPDTNGCQAGTEWACPESAGAQDDDMEGNSHSFHPRPHSGHAPSADVGRCPTGFDAYGATNPSNHGGSTNVSGPYTAGFYPGGPCDYLHATFKIDVYFSPAGRPFPPLDRTWAVIDTQGSSAPYHDYDCAYVSC